MNTLCVIAFQNWEQQQLFVQNVAKIKTSHLRYLSPLPSSQTTQKNPTNFNISEVFFRVVGLGEVARSVHHYHLSSQVKIEIPQPTPPKKILLHPHPAFLL